MERAGSLIGKIKLPPGMANHQEARARAAWRVAAGKRILRYARATMLVRDTLVVEVDDMEWQRQLATMRPLLIANLNKALGAAIVANIDFRALPRKIGPRTAASAHPQTGSATPARDEADAIADPVMRMLYKRSKRSGP